MDKTDIVPMGLQLHPIVGFLFSHRLSGYHGDAVPVSTFSRKNFEIKENVIKFAA